MESRQKKNQFMKILKLKNTYAISFKTTRSSFDIKEYVDENGKIWFYAGSGNGSTDEGAPHVGTSHYQIVEANNLLEVQAHLIEKEIQFRFQSSWQGECLMRELGEKNLPLLINFFTNFYAKEAFEKALKNA